MNCTATVRRSGGVSIIDLAGRITHSAGTGAIRDAIKAELEHDRKNILLNLNAVDYIDSSGLGEMAANRCGGICAGLRIARQCRRDGSVNLGAAAARQAFISSLLHKRVLKDVSRVWRDAAAKREARGNQRIQTFCQHRFPKI